MKRLLKLLKYVALHPLATLEYLFTDSLGLNGWGFIAAFVAVLGALVAFVGIMLSVGREHAMEHLPPGIKVLVRPTSEWTGLYRFRDDAGVTCYGAREGLSCLRVP